MLINLNADANISSYSKDLFQFFAHVQKAQNVKTPRSYSTPLYTLVFSTNLHFHGLVATAKLYHTRFLALSLNLIFKKKEGCCRQGSQEKQMSTVYPQWQVWE